MKKNFTILGMFALLSLCVATVEAKVNYYYCDFENLEQNEEWHYNEGVMAARIPQKWIICDRTNNGGRYSLYVSEDAVDSIPSYSPIASSIAAYTEIDLEKGEYLLSFDWQALGDVEGEKDGLYVLWVPLVDSNFGDSIQINCNNNNEISNTLKSYIIPLDAKNNMLNGSLAWKNCVCSFKADGEPGRLTFIWVSSGRTPVNPGACVDNIELFSVDVCEQPTNLGLQVDEEQSSVHISWQGTSDSYEIRAYNYASKQWYEYSTMGTELDITNFPDGYADFYVRGICGEFHSVNSTISDFIYFPQEHCIPYLQLKDENCFVGTEPVSKTMSVDRMTWQPGKVDNRHTLHFWPYEYDPYTTYYGDGLHTVPEGAMASVRLGNDGTGGESEMVSYPYHVDASENPVLLLKYAVVLQHPGEKCTPNPGFVMRILDSKGNFLDRQCAAASFDYKAAENSEWNISYKKGTTPGDSNDIRWKDWTPVGVDLSKYDGQDLIIQLITYDCGGLGHFGYAYFTMECKKAELDGLTCGEINTEFIAPEGFLYEWTKVAEPEVVVSHERTLKVADNDTCQYDVKMIFEQDSSCYFNLYASAIPFFPTADMIITHTPMECTNKVTFASLAHIRERNQVTDSIIHTDKPVNYVVWDFGDGTTSREQFPIHTYPNEGGDYVITQVAHLSTCTDTLRINYHVPAIGDKMDTLHISHCAGEPYTYIDPVYGDSTFTQNTEYTYYYKTTTGCDSLITLDIHFVDTVYSYIDTLIFIGDTLHFHGKNLTESGLYKAYIKSEGGCDSVVNMNLIVYQTLKAEAKQMYEICSFEPNFTFEYTITQGLSDKYSVQLAMDGFEPIEEDDIPASTGMIDVALPTQMVPNVYHGSFSFIDTISGNVLIPFTLIVDYDSIALAQRWSDVLAVRNHAYNGGYEFISYQWYKNGIMIDGATESILYEPQGLDINAEYKPMVSRVIGQDTVSLFICPIKLQQFSQIEKIPTLIAPAGSMKMPGKGTACWVTPLGQMLEQQVFDDSDILAPAAPGIYLLQIQSMEKKGETYRIVVR